MVRGQGLAKMLTEGNEKALNMEEERDPEMALAILEDLQ